MEDGGTVIFAAALIGRQIARVLELSQYKWVSWNKTRLLTIPSTYRDV